MENGLIGEAQLFISQHPKSVGLFAIGFVGIPDIVLETATDKILSTKNMESSKPLRILTNFSLRIANGLTVATLGDITLSHQLGILSANINGVGDLVKLPNNFGNLLEEFYHPQIQGIELSFPEGAVSTLKNLWEVMKTVPSFLPYLPTFWTGLNLTEIILKTTRNANIIKEKIINRTSNPRNRGNVIPLSRESLDPHSAGNENRWLGEMEGKEEYREQLENVANELLQALSENNFKMNGFVLNIASRIEREEGLIAIITAIDLYRKQYPEAAYLLNPLIAWYNNEVRRQKERLGKK